MLPQSTALLDDLPCDLLDFLAQSRGIGVQAAAELVGDFLMQYERAVAQDARPR